MTNVVFDASSIVGAALKADSLPERALLLARSHETICLSAAVEAEIRQVLRRPKFRKYISEASRDRILDILGGAALMFETVQQVIDCRDKKDNKYLELALAAGASIIVSSDDDLLVLDPWRGIRIVRPVDYVRLGKAGDKPCRAAVLRLLRGGGYGHCTAAWSAITARRWCSAPAASTSL